MERKEIDSNKAILVIGTVLSKDQYSIVRKSKLKIIYLLHPFRYEPTYDAEENIEINLNDEEKVLEKALGFSIKYNIVSVFSINEYRIHLAALIADKLGLSANRLSYYAAMNCLYKKRMRKILNENGISVVQFSLVRSAIEAKDVISKFFYPVVVKPCNDSGSVSVAKCNTFDDVKRAISYIRHSKTNRGGQLYDEDILIEEFIEGPEYSVESCTVNGKTTIFAITNKITTKTFPPIEIGHDVPASLNNSDKISIEELVINAFKVLNIDNTTSHTELKLTDKGPKIIEINPRPGHGRIHNLVKAVTGYNLRDVALQIVLGGAIDDVKSKEDTCPSASSRLFIAENDGILKVSNLESVKSNPSVKEFNLKETDGVFLRKSMSNFDRFGYLTVLGNAQQTSSEIATSVLKELNIRTI